MSTPRLFFGGADILWLADSGATDDGVPFEAGGRFLPIAPAGAGGECAFTSVFLVLTHTAGGQVRITPVVDGREVTASALVLELDAQDPDHPATVSEEIPLFEPLIVGGREYSRQQLRGTWFTLDIRVEGALADGDLAFESIEVEYAVLRRSKEPAGEAPPPPF